MNHIILVGFMGAGKSTLGHALSKLLSMPFVDTDHFIVGQTGKPVSQIFQEFGEDAFRKLEQNVLHEIVQLSPRVIASGGGMPCFFNNMEVMNEHGTTVYMQAPPEVLCSWLLHSSNKRPLIANMTEDELLDYIRKTLAAREPFYLKSKVCVDAHSAKPNELAAKVVEALERNI